jgi:hypothetical protein
VIDERSAARDFDLSPERLDKTTIIKFLK